MSVDPEVMFKHVKPVPFEEYKELLKDWFILKREDGILEVRMCSNGGPGMWCYGLHKGLGQLCHYVANDKENQVMIITGTGDQWLGFPDWEYLQLLQDNCAKDNLTYNRQTYDEWYQDGRAEFMNFINVLEIPTIAAVNGPSPVGHTEFALACDLTLCTPDSIFREGHFGAGLVPGDGQYLALRHLLGDKRTNYLVYTQKAVDAETALEWGLVNEVVERDKILDRAWELARHIMKQNYYTRRLTKLALIQDWRRDVNTNFDFQFALEGWNATMTPPDEGNKQVKKEAEQFESGKPAGTAGSEAV